MTNPLTEHIRRSRNLPLIGVVGATEPTDEYDREMGTAIGYSLRQHIDSRTGTIFTGGVSGVGVDVYRGVINFCLSKGTKGDIPQDRFFVLVPSFVYLHDEELEMLGIHQQKIPYNVPQEYKRLGRLTPNGSVDIIIAGEDMEERRGYMAEIADTLVVVNGNAGTLDEALNAMRRSKRIVTLPSSGGAARILDLLKRNRTGEDVLRELKKAGLDITSVDMQLVQTAANTQEMLEHLYRIL